MANLGEQFVSGFTSDDQSATLKRRGFHPSHKSMYVTIATATNLPLPSLRSTIRDRTQIIDLQIGSGAGAPAAKVTGQRDSYSSVGHCGSHAAMQNTRAVSQFISHAALNGHAVRMTPQHTHADQFIERHILGCFSKLANGQGSTLYHRRMKLKDKVVAVTGGGNGIGRALCRRFAAEGARTVVVADIEGEAAREVAAEIGGVDFAVNVASESDIQLMVDDVLKKHGQIDLFCSNAGIATEGDPNVPDREWQRIWEINVMAHIYAARAVLPGMLARKEGYLLQTVSAAGLLTSTGSAPYAVTKHAAIGLAEWLSITYGDQGIKVSALCPMGVKTRRLENADGGGSFLREGALEPELVAEAVIKGLEEERFLILPHPEVAEFMMRKATDYDRWLRGMRRLQASVMEHK